MINPMTRNGKRLLLAAIGIGLIVFLIHRIGPGTVLHQLASIKTSLPLLILIGIVRLVFQTWNWSIALASEGVQSNALQLAGIRLASIAISYLSSMGPIVAEPLKVALLPNQEIVQKSAPATLAETAIYWFTSVLLGLCGIIAGSLLLAGSSSYASTLWICGASFIFALFFLLSRRSLIGRLSPFFTRINKSIPEWLKKGQEIEDRVRSFRSRCPAATCKLLLIDILSQFLTVMEVFVVLHAAGSSAGFFTLLSIEAIARASKIASIWVPARVGVDETGAAAACALFSINPATGLTLSLARRMRDLLWCCAGLLWLICRKRRTFSTSQIGSLGSKKSMEHGNASPYLP